MPSRLFPAVMAVIICLSFSGLPSAAAAAQTPSAPAPEAGFRHVVTPAGVEAGVWFPASGTPSPQRVGLSLQTVVSNATPLPGRYPLIVMSHGTGGSYSGHADTAIALAKAGFIVAALTHPGDNWQDSSRAVQIEGRPKALSDLISYMLDVAPERGHIDADRIGAFGFSAGGFTVLAAAGGRPDFSRLAGHCQAHPNYFDCQVIARSPQRAPQARPEGVQMYDARIKAVVVAAPALGFTYAGEGLKAVRLPVQLWRADADEILPAPDYADAVRAALPSEPEFHTVANAGHFEFLMPCIDVNMAPEICSSRPGFDRAAFHEAFNVEVMRFFTAHLGDGVGTAQK